MASVLRALRASILGTALVLIGAICLSGTLMVDSDPPFILPRLRLAAFTGVVSSPGASSPHGRYLVTLHWFLNALDFTYPLASKEYQAAGMIYNIDGFVPGEALTLPAHLVTAARRVGLPADAWRCLPDSASGEEIVVVGGGGEDDMILPTLCTETFFEAWAARHRAAEFAFRTDWALYAYYAAFLLLWARTARGLAVAVGMLVFAAASTGRLVSDAAGRLRAVEGVEVEVNGAFATTAWGLVGLGAALWCMAVLRERSQQGGEPDGLDGSKGLEDLEGLGGLEASGVVKESEAEISRKDDVKG
jgi:hypothetical protein